jgi:putative permease
MLKILFKWYNKKFSDPEAILLFILLVLGFVTIMFLGKILAPVFASIIIAYLLQWWVVFLHKRKVPNIVAYLLVYFGFLTLFISSLLILLPMVWRQVAKLITDLPDMFNRLKQLLLQASAALPHFISEQQVDTMIANVFNDLQGVSKTILSASIATIPGVLTWMVYLILVPVLVFFLLKDKDKVIAWGVSFLPQKHHLLSKVWSEMDLQIGNYVRGKVTEILVVGVATYMVFWYFDLRYSVLLASLVGLSVVIPYVGMVMVTIPVMLVGLMQWGFTADFTYMFTVYLIVQALDGNVLVPLLFAEVVNLHPIAIIIAVLMFGALWGFWGVFFAIPLATLVKSVMNSWPDT